MRAHADAAEDDDLLAAGHLVQPSAQLTQRDVQRTGQHVYVALGNLGIILCALVLGTLVWLLYDMGLMSSTRSSVMVWLILVVIGIILGIGLSWSLIRQRTTGQVEVD